MKKGTAGRRGDDRVSARRFGAERLFHATDGWYFATREGDVGPFMNQKTAMQAAQTYLGKVLKRKNDPLTIRSHNQ